MWDPIARQTFCAEDGPDAGENKSQIVELLVWLAAQDFPAFSAALQEISLKDQFQVTS